jgi:hypothetical protein
MEGSDMSLEEIPSWSASASESIGLLYRGLQPIEVYVEDSNSEAFYLELLNRMIAGEDMIKKIIPLHGRSHVLKVCEEYSDPNPAIFLIDGDLDLLLGARETGYRNLFQLRSYCIENYLFCSIAARELIAEGSGVTLREQALSKEEWADFCSSVLSSLKELFVVFAAARKVKPDLKTVSHGLAAILTQRGRGERPFVDREKIEILKSDIAGECIKAIGEVAWRSELQVVHDYGSNLHPLDVVSGKDFLLPMLSFLIRAKGCGSMSTASLMFKLAKYCSLDRLDELKTALAEVLAGNGFISN